MTGDDARIAHLAGDSSDALDDGDRRRLDDLAGLLADPSVWATPPDDLEDRVVAAISAEADDVRSGDASPGPVAS